MRTLLAALLVVASLTGGASAQDRSSAMALLAPLKAAPQNVTPRSDLQLAQYWQQCGFATNCLGPDSYCCNNGETAWCCSRFQGCGSNAYTCGR